jgi:hypothetical protein
MPSIDPDVAGIEKRVTRMRELFPQLTHTQAVLLDKKMDKLVEERLDAENLGEWGIPHEIAGVIFWIYIHDNIGALLKEVFS